VPQFAAPDRTSRRVAHVLTLIGGFAALYSLTANWGYEANVDAIAAALPAWSIVAHGTIVLDQFAGLNPWLVDGVSGTVSNRPPGISAIAVPAYIITRPEVFTNGPATASAIAVTIGSLVVLYLTLCRVASSRLAFGSTVVMGAGTCTWLVSSSALWPHGPGQLWAALAIAALARERYLTSGWALGGAILTRPVTAVSTAVLGISESVRTRSLAPMVGIGAPVTIALAGLITYNRAVFGRWSVLGGYPADFTDRITSQGWSEYLQNLVGMFVAPTHGLFIWSPIVLVAAVGLVSMWPSIPGWARSAAIAALIYLLVHARLNRASGGAAFGYRYPLEPLMLAAPALVLGARHLLDRGGVGTFAVRLSLGVSIALQMALVFLLSCEVADGVARCTFRGV
jgi:hypothetical protein